MNQKIPLISLKLYKIRAMILWAQYKTQQTRKDTDLKAAITQLLNHLYLDPQDLDGWLLLAQCHKSQVDEMMSGNAIEVQKSKKSITNVQRRSFLAYVQVIKLLKQLSKKEIQKLYVLNSRKELASMIWADFGYLCQTMLSLPMDLSRTSVNPALDKNEILLKLSKIAKDAGKILDMKQEVSIRHAFSTEKTNQSERRRGLIQASLYAYTHALNLCKDDWKYALECAHLSAKLGRDPQEVINLFARAVENTPLADEDRILDSLMKLSSYLAKGLFSNLIHPSIVRQTYSSVIKSALSLFSGASISSPFSLKYGKENSDPDPHGRTGTLALADEKRAAFDILLKLFEKLKALDKRNVYHKLSFRVSFFGFSPEAGLVALLRL
jgi:hypothetical protein